VASNSILYGPGGLPHPPSLPFAYPHNQAVNVIMEAWGDVHPGGHDGVGHSTKFCFWDPQNMTGRGFLGEELQMVGGRGEGALLLKLRLL